MTERKVFPIKSDMSEEVRSWGQSFDVNPKIITVPSDMSNEGRCGSFFKDSGLVKTDQ